MPLITLEKAKKILKITDALSDDLINSLLLPVQEQIINYCNNDFVLPGTLFGTNTLTFAAADNSLTNSVVDTTSNDFTSVYYSFAALTDIRIQGSRFNDGFYTIETLEAQKMAFNLLTDQQILDEAAYNFIQIERVRFPVALALTAAKLIKFHMDGNTGKKSESLGDWSASFSDDIPKDIKMELNIFRRVF